MEMRRVLICVALMAIVTYIPRVLPLTLFRKPIRSKHIRSFLDYTPYAVLGAMTFPDVFFSTGSLASAALGTAAALVSQLQRKRPGNRGLRRDPCGLSGGAFVRQSSVKETIGSHAEIICRKAI